MPALRLPALLTAAAAAFGLAGCGGLDTAKAERVIADGIERQLDLDGVRVDCPEGIDEKQGVAFTCTAYGPDGSAAPVGVVQRDGDGEVAWQLNPDSPLPRQR